MDQTLSIAKALYDMHYREYGRRMDQMRMHKLMYYVQKTSLAQTDEPLFSDNFQGWKWGPVLPRIRHEYAKENPFADVDGTISKRAARIVKKVYEENEGRKTWDLNSQTHEEFSWKLSRMNLEPEESGCSEISLDAIRLDVLQDMVEKVMERREV